MEKVRQFFDFVSEASKGKTKLTAEAALEKNKTLVNALLPNAARYLAWTLSVVHPFLLGSGFILS